MYLGNIVEMGETDTIIHHPLHPYTQALISNCASIDLDEKQRAHPHRGRPPSPVDPKPCCPFAGRCFCEQEICRREKPQLRQMADGPRGGLSSGEGKIVRERQAPFPAG